MSVPYEGDSTSQGTPGIKGTNNAGGVGVWGESDKWEGVHGVSHAQAAGVAGINDGPANATAAGVYGESQHWEGVTGVSHTQAAGVAGYNHATSGGPGIYGQSDSGRGVEGIGTSWQGVYGHSTSQAGVVGESDQFDGVWGISHDPQHAGVSGHNPGGLAGYFEGNVTVTGDIMLSGGDCAEDFDLAGTDDSQPGTVMVISQDGRLQQSRDAYDKRVAGVLSGAGSLKAGIVLDKQQAAAGKRKALALVGKVYCKVDAEYAPIQVGDLLTSSPTPGHAMKASDPTEAFGAVLGKALQPHASGCGLIPILVALQ